MAIRRKALTGTWICSLRDCVRDVADFFDAEEEARIVHCSSKASAKRVVRLDRVCPLTEDVNLSNQSRVVSSLVVLCESRSSTVKRRPGKSKKIYHLAVTMGNKIKQHLVWTFQTVILHGK